MENRGISSDYLRSTSGSGRGDGSKRGTLSDTDGKIKGIEQKALTRKKRAQKALTSLLVRLVNWSKKCYKIAKKKFSFFRKRSSVKTPELLAFKKLEPQNQNIGVALYKRVQKLPQKEAKRLNELVVKKKITAFSTLNEEIEKIEEEEKKLLEENKGEIKTLCRLVSGGDLSRSLFGSYLLSEYKEARGKQAPPTSSLTEKSFENLKGTALVSYISLLAEEASSSPIDLLSGYFERAEIGLEAQEIGRILEAMSFIYAERYPKFNLNYSEWQLVMNMLLMENTARRSLNSDSQRSEAQFVDALASALEKEPLSLQHKELFKNLYQEIYKGKLDLAKRN